MSTLAETTTGPARWHPTRITAALLSFCTVVLVIVGSFLPLYSGELSFGPDDIEVTITPWSADVTGVAEPGDVPTTGYPLVFAAIVLAAAAALCWYAATPATSPGVGRVSAVTTAIGGAFLIGTVWTTATMVVNGVDSVILFGTLTPGLETEATYLVGFWLLLVAALLSLCAAVLALVPVRTPTWAQLNPEVATPPYGIALPLRPVQQQIPGPLQVDPLTGHPLTGPLPQSPPLGVPAVYPPPPPPAQTPGRPSPAEPPRAETPALAPPPVEPPPVEPPPAEPRPAEPRPAEPPHAAAPTTSPPAEPPRT